MSRESRLWQTNRGAPRGRARIWILGRRQRRWQKTRGTMPLRVLPKSATTVCVEIEECGKRSLSPIGKFFSWKLSAKINISSNMRDEKSSKLSYLKKRLLNLAQFVVIICVFNATDRQAVCLPVSASVWDNAYIIPFSRRWSCHFHADAIVSASGVSAFHPSTVLARVGSAHTWMMSPVRRPVIL